MTPKKKVALDAVLRCATAFNSIGWSVYFPLDESGPIDFIICKQNHLLRVQVKATKKRKGCVYVNLKSANNWQLKRYSCNDCDLIVGYDHSDKKAYLVNMEDFEGMYGVVLRIDPVRNNQSKLIRMAKDFFFFDDGGVNLLNASWRLPSTPP